MSPARILLVEDDAVARLIVRESLTQLRLVNPIVEATDVAAAMRVLEEPGNPRPPVLVLLDGTLPDGTGIDVLRFIKARPALADVAVVMLTSSSDADRVNEAYALGASSYLVKPVGYEALSDVLRGLALPWQLLQP
jgi:response regulator of citrate/malate metabolism